LQAPHGDGQEDLDHEPGPTPRPWFVTTETSRGGRITNRSIGWPRFGVSGRPPTRFFESLRGRRFSSSTSISPAKLSASTAGDVRPGVAPQGPSRGRKGCLAQDAADFQDHRVPGDGRPIHADRSCVHPRPQSVSAFASPLSSRPFWSARCRLPSFLERNVQALVLGAQGAGSRLFEAQGARLPSF
jgi:hypothetical protein